MQRCDGGARVNWHPLSEKPQTDEVVSGLIACRDEADGEFFLMGIYLWRNGHWVNEDQFKPLPPGEYWYVFEEELCADLKGTLAA